MAGKEQTADRDSDAATPAKPRTGGSRQQTQPDQQSQTGSPAYDREATERSGGSDTRARKDVQTPK